MSNHLKFDGLIIRPTHSYSEGTVRVMKGPSRFLRNVDPLPSIAYHLIQNLEDILVCHENYDVQFYRVFSNGYDYSEVLKLGSHNLFCGVILTETFSDYIALKTGTVSLKTNRLFLENFISIF